MGLISLILGLGSLASLHVKLATIHGVTKAWGKIFNLELSDFEKKIGLFAIKAFLFGVFCFAVGYSIRP